MLNPDNKRNRSHRQTDVSANDTTDLRQGSLKKRGSIFQDSFAQFTSNISKIPLLTPDEEKQLAEERIKAESEKQKISQQLMKKKLAPEKRLQLENKLAKHQNDIDKVVCTFMEKNVRLALKIAFGFQYTGLELEDLNAAAYSGLRRAAELFDPEKGGKFSTYASNWIKQSIHRYCANNGRTVRLPVHVLAKIGRLNQITKKLTQELSREPSEEELAEELGISSDKLRTLIRHKNARTVHIDAPLNQGESDSDSIASIIPDNNAIIPGTSAVSSDKMSILIQTLSTLKPKERQIIELRFGIHNGGEGMTLEQVGAKFSVTRERIRQIQNVALKKMRKRYKQLDVPTPAGKSLARINKDSNN